MMKKVAFVLLNWPLTTYVMQLVEAFVANGGEVDIYTDSIREHLVDANRYKTNSKMKVYSLDFSLSKKMSQADCQSLLFATSNHVETQLGNNCYDLIIGVEKIGFCFAYMLSTKKRTPLVYWSLELYNKEHSWWSQGYSCPDFWLRMESFALKKSAGLIIQDKDRASVLYDYTGCQGIQTFYLPITIGQSEIKSQGGFFLHELCGLPHETKLLVQFGNNRMPAEWVLRIAESLPNTWMLVLHGLLLKEASHLQHPRLCLSNTKVAEKDIPELIASARVGLVHYRNIDTNDVLTAHSSEKLARYLAAGIPVLAHDVGNYASVFAQNNAGLTFSAPEQVGVAVAILGKNYDVFRRAALNAGKGYIFENYEREVVEFCRYVTKVKGG